MSFIKIKNPAEMIKVWKLFIQKIKIFNKRFKKIKNLSRNYKNSPLQSAQSTHS